MVNKFYLVIYCLGASLLLTSINSAAETSRFNTWLTVQDIDLRVEKGSALDLEPLFQPSSAATKKWNEPYFCAPLVFTRPDGFISPKNELEQMVAELKSRGYNLVRLHFVDNALMKGATKDFDFNKEQVDRIFYLLYLLKRNNIDYIIDAATSRNGAYGDVGKNRFIKKHNLKLDVHFNPAVQAHWKKMVDLMFNSVNPYTGRTVISEPNLVAITAVNEMGLRFNIAQSKQFSVELKYNFQRWLSAQGKRVETPKIGDASEASKLMNTFLMETERKTIAWMTKYLRQLGYQGDVTAYNNGRAIQSMGVRQDLELLSIHAYHDHPSRFIKKGSQIKNNSSIAAELPYIQKMSLVREVGKPFIVDEYDQPYWSEWRREAGIAMASFASFQGWQAICRYANPVALKYAIKVPKRKRVIHPFAIGVDPVARAGEVLAALLFRRQDVTPGGTVSGVLFKNSDFTSEVAFNRWLPDTLTKLSFLTPIGVMYNQAEDYNVDVVIPFVMQGGQVPWEPKWKRWNANVKVLANSNVLYSNTLEFKKELVSSTGEIFLNPSEKRLKVITDKTEAIVYDKLISAERLNQLTVLQASGKSVLSASSLDNKGLNAAKRVLVIFATDARNSFSRVNNNGTRLLSLGRLPIQIKSQSVFFSLENQNASSMRFYALNLQGKRVERLPLQKAGNKLLVEIDLSKLKNGPTTFFELAVD